VALQPALSCAWQALHAGEPDRFEGLGLSGRPHRLQPALALAAGVTRRLFDGRAGQCGLGIAALVPKRFRGGLGLQLFFLQGLSLQRVLACRARPLDCDGAARCMTAPIDSRFRHAHDFIRYPLGFLFVNVVRVTDGELGLQQPRA
jgi:hypothetical protein